MPPKRTAAAAVASITQQPPQNIYDEYFETTRKYQEQYGPRTLVLMQVGAFFEVYGLKDAPEGPQSLIHEFCQIGGLKLAEKSKERHRDCPVLMAGFGEYNLEKYLKLLTDQGLTCAVFKQEDDMRKAGAKRRVLHSVYSAGTFVPMEEGISAAVPTANNIMVVWVRQFQSLTGPKYACAFAATNSLTGESFLYEYTTQAVMSPTAFDDLERAVASFAPNEAILIHAAPHETDAQKILQYIGLQSAICLHRVPESGEKVQKCLNSVFVRTLLSRYFTAEAADVCAEFTTYEFATQCFCFLMDFVQDHNPNWVRRIGIPTFANSSSRVVLANHTLKQLNILGSAASGGRTSSVMRFLSRAKTAMGSRLLEYQLLNPVFDCEWIKQEYDATSRIQAEPVILNTLRELLGEVRDLEKMGRQILMGRILPSAIYQLHRSMGVWEKCLETGVAGLNVYLGVSEIASHRKETRRLMEYIETRLVFNGGESGQFQKGVCPKLDKMQVELQENMDFIEGFRGQLNILLGSADTPADHVKIHETAKSGRSLIITQTRAHALRDLLRKGGNSSFDVGDVRVLYSDIRVVSSRAEKTDVMDCPAIDRASRQILTLQEKIAERTETLFAEFLQGLEREFYTCIVERSRAIALLDVLTTKAALAREFNYCRPVVAAEDGAGWADARELRHALIEHIQTNEIYVANDLAIGVPGQRGILLYGTNAVGKTSLIKALGIAVVMAQAGWFVPATSFQYAPYRAIYSRILGNDDIFRGLSTFVVEMSELRVILRMADEGSLVLGDEVCSGTETESALSIFTAGLQHLYERRTSFIFATHFHEIVKYEEVRAMEDEVRAMHMCVSYDAELGALVYDRKLRPGSGDAIYGLEVAKSLFMPEDFLERAFAIRTKYFAGVDKSPLAFQTTSYHSKKVRDICEVCREEIGTEIHHLSPQKMADDRGFIGTFHKNHPANLVSICEKCHVKIHGAGASAPTKRKKTTRGTVLLPA